MNKVFGKLHWDFGLAEDKTANVLEDEINTLLLYKGAGEKEQGLLNAVLHGVPMNASTQGQPGIIQETNRRHT